MDAIKYFEEKRRMLNSLGRTGGRCNGVDCVDCPLSCWYTKHELTCSAFETEYPEEAVAIVEKWAEEHPQKTILMDFLENCCPSEFGYKDEKNCRDCACIDCWNRPLE